MVFLKPKIETENFVIRSKIILLNNYNLKGTRKKTIYILRALQYHCTCTGKPNLSMSVILLIVKYLNQI